MHATTWRLKVLFHMFLECSDKEKKILLDKSEVAEKEKKKMMEFLSLRF